eukprot:2378377-Ditylum_brightwellii.AAC.1
MLDTLPFAMDPVVYDVSINDCGTGADWCDNGASLCKNASDDMNNSKRSSKQSKQEILDEVLTDLGCDRKEHEEFQTDMKNGVIDLAPNCLPIYTKLEGVHLKDIVVAEDAVKSAIQECGLAELKKGTVGVVTLAADIGSRWTQETCAIKAISPFAKLGGQHWSFLEVHLAKNQNISELVGTNVPH